jgi:hypothetical protein
MRARTRVAYGARTRDLEIHNHPESDGCYATLRKSSGNPLVLHDSRGLESGGARRFSDTGLTPIRGPRKRRDDLRRFIRSVDRSTQYTTPHPESTSDNGIPGCTLGCTSPNWRA